MLLTWQMLNRFIKRRKVVVMQNIFPAEVNYSLQRHLSGSHAQQFGIPYGRYVTKDINGVKCSDFVDYKIDGGVGRLLFTRQDVKKFSSKRAWWLAWLIGGCNIVEITAIDHKSPWKNKKQVIKITDDKLQYINDKVYNLIENYSYLFEEENGIISVRLQRQGG